MWYLIVPPIIIISCLGILLWYLSRKSTDPMVAERLAGMPDGEPVSLHFSRTNEFMLRFLEKFAQRLKVNALRFHNWLHNWLQSIRANRKKVQAIKEQIQVQAKQERLEESRTQESLPTAPSLESFSARPSFPAEASLAAEEPTAALAEPFFRRRKTFFGRRGQQENVLSEEPALPISSPVFEARHVEQVVQEPPTPVVPQRPVLSEEDLIGRIANNPKDFSSYEALGDYYLESGNTKDAKECYRQVLKLRPQERSVKIKIRRLEKMLSQR